MEECEWRQLLAYGEKQASDRGMRPEDVAALVEEYRAEVDSARRSNSDGCSRPGSK